MSSIAIVYPDGDAESWASCVRRLSAETTVEVWPEIRKTSEITTAICWNQPEGILGNFQNLKLAASLAAGADHLVNDKSISHDVIITRVKDPFMGYSVSRYVVAMVLLWERNLFDHIRYQDLAMWEEKTSCRAVDSLILGNGNIGSTICESLSSLGYAVSTWSKSKEVELSKKYLLDSLRHHSVVIGALPLTPSTERFFDTEFFSSMQKGSLFVQVGRGNQLVEEDLLEAIDSGYVGHAVLDVVPNEPLEPDHLFWKHCNITLTPHIAGINDQEFAVKNILENHYRVLNGVTPEDLVTRSKGY